MAGETYDLFTGNGKDGLDIPGTVPFESVTEAWFWFIQAQQARNDGVQLRLGAGLFPRPCEPVDILRVLDRLYRQRRLLRDHLLVLRHYGRRQMPPDPQRVREYRAFCLWEEALERIEPVLVAKGIVTSPARYSGPCQLAGQAAE